MSNGGDSLEKLRALQITSLEDEQDDEAQVNGGGDVMDDDDDDEEEEEEEVPVTLGFVEKPKNRWSLLRQLFPSKAGGVPAWLNPIDLPSGRSCHCDICGQPLQFLLQVYAPLAEKEFAFHRTLFVFMCPSMACLLQDQHEQWKHQPEKASRSVKIFRCQLARLNSFYSSDPPRHDGTDKPSGIGGSLQYSSIAFSSTVAMHWMSGHKIECRQMSISQSSNTIPASSSAETPKGQRPEPWMSTNHGRGNVINMIAMKTQWPEYEIINEDESELEIEISEDNRYANSLVSAGSQMDEAMKSLLDNFEGDGDRKSWASFQECLSRAPDQVLRGTTRCTHGTSTGPRRGDLADAQARYCRIERVKPLWPMSSGRPSKTDIPNCSYCGGPRCFEFQILPQLLYYFGVRNDVDSLDWATIVVYACEASCEGTEPYKEEFGWVQLSSQSAPVR
ncbi:Programmed cell death protein [Actinidia chinensis var. chinensis]|uniref:Programmed cell death protein n=1 Tax=Actinidia chinensis var. chinensis TaxID=1590841 RepID=A0A2R6PNU5_ACTCC|nr:Programmed cell death protein [Actinidia chinensis var. chinensis]